MRRNSRWPVGPALEPGLAGEFRERLNARLAGIEARLEELRSWLCSIGDRTPWALIRGRTVRATRGLEIVVDPLVVFGYGIEEYAGAMMTVPDNAHSIVWLTPEGVRVLPFGQRVPECRIDLALVAAEAGRITSITQLSAGDRP